DVKVPYGSWDSRVGAFRALAMYYPEILQFLRRSQLDFKDDVLDLPP
ncbi:ATP-dependent helicase, partial [Candidatus Bathyarchaeota archaeon]|nr:ATP-dependent helicase [Candidatus Bathyarchaeota archaeon]